MRGRQIRGGGLRTKTHCTGCVPAARTHIHVRTRYRGHPWPLPGHTRHSASLRAFVSRLRHKPSPGGGLGRGSGALFVAPDKANGRIRGAATRLTPATSSRRKPGPSDLGSCQRRSPLWSRIPGPRWPKVGGIPAFAASRERFACPGYTCCIPSVGPGALYARLPVLRPEQKALRARPSSLATTRLEALRRARSLAREAPGLALGARSFVHKVPLPCVQGSKPCNDEA